MATDLHETTTEICIELAAYVNELSVADVLCGCGTKVFGHTAIMATQPLVVACCQSLLNFTFELLKNLYMFW